MHFRKLHLLLPALLATTAMAEPGIQSQPDMQMHDAACRLGQYSPIVGIWTGNLSFTLPGLGQATVLIAVNQGGTFMETDSIDLNNTVGTATPGYAAWKALDCRHYALTINKTLYNGGQFSQILLPGTLELSEDGQTLTISLKQHVFNQSGTEVATGTVTGSAKRANAGNGE
jgi:hypothetical protein